MFFNNRGNLGTFCAYLVDMAHDGLLHHIRSRGFADKARVGLFVGQAEKILLPWKKRIGLDESESSIATELSDFLIDVNQKINNLPIIYQRLYKISPLTEMGLFIGRKQELDLLVVAYKN